MTSRNFDGFLMLFISIIFILLSLGLTLILTLLHTCFIAIKASCTDREMNYIVILGKKLVNNQPDKDYRLRLDRALNIAKNRAHIKIHILGGITDSSRESESKMGRRYLNDNNIETKNIYIEEQSKDTLDNMKKFKNNLLPTEKNITLITNRYHLARASIMAQGFGFNVKKCAAEEFFTPSLLVYITLLSEAFFLHWYLSGRLYAKVTCNKRMLTRIE